MEAATAAGMPFRVTMAATATAGNMEAATRRDIMPRGHMATATAMDITGRPRITCSPAITEDTMRCGRIMGGDRGACGFR